MAALSRIEFTFMPYAARADALPQMPPAEPSSGEVAQSDSFAVWAGQVALWTDLLDEWISRQPDWRALRALLALFDSNALVSPHGTLAQFVRAIARGKAVIEMNADRVWEFT